jgi:hypothetical protein
MNMISAYAGKLARLGFGICDCAPTSVCASEVAVRFSTPFKSCSAKLCFVIHGISEMIVILTTV